MPAAVDLIGSVAAVITTVGWLPQVMKIRRERKADDISMIATAAIGNGVLLWFFYGLLIGSWPVIAANGVTFLFVAAILLLKMRYARLPATPRP